MASSPRGSVAGGRASLIGGIVVGIAVFLLWLALMHELGTEGLVSAAIGLIISAGIGIWIRRADL
jgi:hypothetical protein